MVFTLTESLSVLLKWASTFPNLEAQCRYELTLHALFCQAAQAQRLIRAAILFTSDGFPHPMFRVNLLERQIRFCVVIGCCLPDAEEIANA